LGVRESFRQSSERMKGVTISCLRLHDAETEEYFEEATKEGAAVDTLVSMRSVFVFFPQSVQRRRLSTAYKLGDEQSRFPFKVHQEIPGRHL
jgi:hypothetical protein